MNTGNANRLIYVFVFNTNSYAHGRRIHFYAELFNLLNRSVYERLFIWISGYIEPQDDISFGDL